MRCSIRRRGFVLLSAAALIFGCGGGERKSPARALDDSIPPDTAVSVAGADPRRTVLFIGTSLTAALGLDPSQGYPGVIQQKIDSAGLPFRVVNAGVSGETAAGARRRVESWLARQPFDVVVLEMGANDMLRGADLDSLRANLRAIVDTLRATRPAAPIVLAGMLAVPNLGEQYGVRFRGIYQELARRDSLPLVPFLLEGVAGRPELNQGDGIHPNARGQRIVAENVWRVLAPVLRRVAAADSTAPPPKR